MERKEKKFFQKVWTSVKDFEGYEEFAAERVSKAVIYLLILTLLFTVIITLTYTYQFYSAIKNVKNYVNQNIEEISLVGRKIRSHCKRRNHH